MSASRNLAIREAFRQHREEMLQAMRAWRCVRALAHGRRCDAQGVPAEMGEAAGACPLAMLDAQLMSKVVDMAYPGRGNLVGAFDARSRGARLAAARQRAAAFRVCVRCRPLLAFELEAGEFMAVDVDRRRAEVACHDCRLSRNGRRLNVSHRLYAMDRAWGAAATHADVYESVRPLVQRSLTEARDSATVLCYGQTGTGKTYTLNGLLQHVAADLTAETRVEMSFVEVHGAKCYDLLADHKLVHLRQGSDGRVHARGATLVTAAGGAELLELARAALDARASESTERNEASSRSHAVCTLTMVCGQGQHTTEQANSTPAQESAEIGAGEESAGAESAAPTPAAPPSRPCLRLVDLAGSERNYETTKMSAAQHRESSDINKALMALKDCFRAHAAGVAAAACGGEPPRVPFRAHRLTQMLKDCFVDGTHRTLVIATASPSPTDLMHTMNTLDHVALMAAPLELLVDTVTCELVLGAAQMAGDADPLEEFNAVPVQKWDSETTARWVATIEDGRFKDFVLPPGTKGVDLLRLSAERLSNLWVNPDVRHGGGVGEGPAWTLGADSEDDEHAAEAVDGVGVAGGEHDGDAVRVRRKRDVGRALFAALRKQIRRGAAAEAKRRWAKQSRDVDVERAASLAREACAPSVQRTVGGRQVVFWSDGFSAEDADDVAERAQSLLLDG